MKTAPRKFVWLLIAMFAFAALPALSYGWEPNDKDLSAAVESSDYDGYLTKINEYLVGKTPTDSAKLDEAGLIAIVQDPIVAKTLCQRQLIAKTGAANLAKFAKASPDNQKFLGWLLDNADAMTLYLEGATPISMRARDDNSYTLNTGVLDTWKTIWAADPESHEGLYLRLAEACSLAPPGSTSPGAGQAKVRCTPLERYNHFKSAHKSKELFPSFDALTVWEMTKVVGSGASNEDLAWARAMVNTWRPDLRVNEQVVNTTSEVWRRNSPHPYVDYKAVLSGGGKCGPRSSWSVMICQAFGIPAVGVGQPAHACVAYKTVNPNVQPQPGSAWKVGYGRGWQVSRLEGMGGLEFLACVNDRAHVPQFSQVEHLRWLSSTPITEAQKKTILEVAHSIQKSSPTVKTDVTASLNKDEMDAEVKPQATAAANAAQPPLKITAGENKIEADAFTGMAGIRVLKCYTGGKQVNYQKSLDDSWVEYTLDVAEAGTYALQLKVAAVNLDQVLNVEVNGEKVAVKVPYSKGLWDETPAAEIKLAQGKQTLKISAPNQRGVALRVIEVKKS